MDHGRVIKKIFEGKPQGRRRIGRPKLRWLHGVEKDLWDIKVKRWQQKRMDREDRVSVIKELKAFRGPQSQGVSK
jgi:hypothetical protein